MRNIAIIGAAGNMGSWFTHYFARRGFVVSVYDVREKMLTSKNNIRTAKDIRSCVKDADLVLVCVPVSMTPRIIAVCAKSMKDGAVISEISSVKHKTFSALRKVPSRLKPLCIHPMFGPGASGKIQSRILMIPVRNEEAEMKVLLQLFENPTIRVMPDVRTHDKSIATVLGLTYFVNLAFAKIVSEGNIRLFKQISGTTFSLQSVIAESILINEPDLITALIRENPYAKKYIEQYMNEAEIIAKMASARDNRKLKHHLKNIRSKMQKWQDLQESYRRMYGIIEGLKQKQK